MADKGSSKVGETVQSFLASPLDKRCFDPFFKLCYSETIQYLRRLRSSGWRLPEDQVQQENVLADIAYDVLGPFLASKRHQPYFVIFDYFDRHGLSETNATPDTIAEHFRILLRGFIRKELTLIRGLENPQIKNLKRRINDLLNGPDYASKVYPGENEACVFAVRNVAKLRDDLPLIPPEFLDRIVREAFQLSLNRSEWCAQVFQLLDMEPEGRAAIPRHRLISTMVAVNAEYADAAGIVTGFLPTPREEHLYQTTRRIMQETVDWLQSFVIPRFVAKGRLSSEDAPLVLRACKAYLNDLSQDGDADKIPQYFLLLKPGLSQSDYLTQYKFLMDTVINRGLVELRRRLREDPTIWPFGVYSPAEES